jgi:hypothetical protein
MVEYFEALEIKREGAGVGKWRMTPALLALADTSDRALERSMQAAE